jgi:hypothetical protein
MEEDESDDEDEDGPDDEEIDTDNDDDDNDNEEDEEGLAISSEFLLNEFSIVFVSDTGPPAANGFPRPNACENPRRYPPLCNPVVRDFLVFSQ